MSGAVRTRASGVMVRLPLTASVGEARSAIPDGGWVGITSEDGSVVGLAADEDLQVPAREVPLAVVARSLPPLVTVAADAAAAVAVCSPAFRVLGPRHPVLVEDAGEPIGVWAGRNLAEAIVSFGSWRSAGVTDASLQGEIGISEIRAVCHHREAGTDCLATRTFPEPPEDMPECENPRCLSEHAFEW
jgi:hypothetical protein